MSLIVADLARGGRFLRWLSAKLLGDIYPGAPNERKVFAALLLNNLIEAWCYQGDLNTGKLRRKQSQEKGSQAHCTDRLQVIGPELAQAASSLAILGKFLYWSLPPIITTTSKVNLLLMPETLLHYNLLRYPKVVGFLW